MPSSACKKCALDRKSTRLNSSHTLISYAVFCLKKKNLHKSKLRRPALPRDEFRAATMRFTAPHLRANCRASGVLPVDLPPLIVPFFFFNDTATTEIYTLSLHDALPI